MTSSSALDEAALRHAVGQLAARDADLAAIVERHGPPPLWARPADFATLVAIVLEQQVSLRSGAAALGRLRAAAGSLEPGAIVAGGGGGAPAAGATPPKARYRGAPGGAAPAPRVHPGRRAG